MGCGLRVAVFSEVFAPKMEKTGTYCEHILYLADLSR
jgi:hypothetical protein